MWIKADAFRVAQINKHDKYVRLLYEQIKADYDSVYTHLPLFSKKCLIGEIDLLAFKKDTIHIFEVKCSFRICKAKKQLRKAKKLFQAFDGWKIKTFFYCGVSKQLVFIT